MVRIDKRLIFSMDIEKSYKEVNKLTADEFYKFIIDNASSFNFRTTLDIKSSCIFLHKELITSYTGRIEELVKDIIKAQWKKKLVNKQPLIITKNTFNISNEKIQELIDNKSDFNDSRVIEYDKPIVNYIYGEEENEVTFEKRVLYEFENDNQLITVIPHKNKIIYQNIYKLTKPKEISSVGYVYNWLTNRYHSFIKQNQAFILISLSHHEIKKQTNNSNDLIGILKKSYSNEAYMNERGSKYYHILYGERKYLNKRFTRKDIEKKILNRYEIPTLFKGFGKHIEYAHQVFLRSINTNLFSIKGCFKIAKHYHKSLIGITSEHLDSYFKVISKFEKDELSISEYPNYLLTNQKSLNLINGYLTNKASLLLLGQESKEEVAASLHHIEGLVSCIDKYYNDYNEHYKPYRREISNIIKSDENNINVNLTNYFFALLDKWYDNSNFPKFIQFINKEFKFDEEYYYSIYHCLKGLLNNNLDKTIDSYLNLFNVKEFVNHINSYRITLGYKECGPTIYNSLIHDYFVDIRDILNSKLISKIEIKNKVNSDELKKSIINNGVIESREILVIIKYMESTIRLIEKVDSELWKSKSKVIYQDIYKCILNKDVKGLQIVYDSISSQLNLYLLNGFNDSEKNYLINNVFKQINQYSPNVNADYLISWLGENTVRKISRQELYNPFPLVQISYESDYISGIMKSMLGVRSKGIKGKYKNPHKLYNELKKHHINPKEIIDKKVNGDIAHRVHQVLNKFDIKTDINKMKEYDLFARVEDKNTGNYIAAGNASVCCMSIGNGNMKDYIEEEGFSIINFYYKDRVIGNSLIWLHSELNILVIDNVEVHPNYKRFNSGIEHLLFKVIEGLNEKLKVDLVVVGTDYNDISLNKYINKFKHYTEELEQHWYPSGKNIEEDFYTDAEECDVIWVRDSFDISQLATNLSLSH